jgi:signal transduction histidine kinase
MLDLERLSLSSERRCSVDLVATTRDVVADLAPMAIARGYDLALTAPDGPIFVIAEVHGVVRALTNIVGNAIVHAGGSGQITVVVGEDRTIDVVDAGPGIAEVVRDRLFEPFSRGSTEAEGSGLGLHIAREIMRSHGGDVSLLPTASGATFRLSFPEGS